MFTIMFSRDSPVRKPICALAGVISLFLLLLYPWASISQVTLTTPAVPLSRTTMSETGALPLIGSLILIPFIEANPENNKMMIVYNDRYLDDYNLGLLVSLTSSGTHGVF